MGVLYINTNEETGVRTQTVNTGLAASRSLHFSVLLHKAVFDQVVEQHGHLRDTQVKLLAQLGYRGISRIGEISKYTLFEVDVLIGNTTDVFAVELFEEGIVHSIVSSEVVRLPRGLNYAKK